MTVSHADRLFQEGFSFDYFQAVRLLHRLQPKKVLIGQDGPPNEELVRIAAWPSLAFPASTIHTLEKPLRPEDPPRMTVAFMGLFGPSGVLPRHYTELIVREGKDPEIQALRDWLDLFNHRFISLFYRAWEKYRFYVPYERGEFAQKEIDRFSQVLFSLVGLGFRSHRNRFRIVYQEPKKPVQPGRETVLAQLPDHALLRFGGLFAHRPRSAVSLEVLLAAYLKLPVKVLQFQGQWLRLEKAGQTSLTKSGQNNSMGLNTLVGDRIWDVGGKVRVRLGPLTYAQFLDFMPDPTPVKERKKIYLLAQVVRLYLGPELDVEFQLVLKKEEVPGTAMGQKTAPVRSRLGWNTWSKRKPALKDADDPVFMVEEKTLLNR